MTGVSTVTLQGTGMTDAYLRTISSIVPAGLLDRLFEAFDNATAHSAHGGLTAILDDSDLGPVARAIAVLWYCGAWTELPGEWRAKHGSAPSGGTGVLSGAAYQAGLQWTVVGAHPAGARQQGFAAWSTEPVDVLS